MTSLPSVPFCLHLPSEDVCALPLGALSILTKRFLNPPKLDYDVSVGFVLNLPLIKNLVWKPGFLPRCYGLDIVWSILPKVSCVWHLECKNWICWVSGKWLRFGKWLVWYPITQSWRLYKKKERDQRTCTLNTKDMHAHTQRTCTLTHGGRARSHTEDMHAHTREYAHSNTEDVHAHSRRTCMLTHGGHACSQTPLPVYPMTQLVRPPADMAP